MSDANRFLSGVMAKATVNRPVLARALRMETVPAIIDTFTVMYTEDVQAVPQDGKKYERVQKILMSLNQDQQILVEVLNVCRGDVGRLGRMQRLPRGCGKTWENLRNVQER